MATHSIVLAWRIPRTEELSMATVHSVGKESDMTKFRLPSGSIIWVGQKVPSILSVSYDGKTWMNFLANPIYQSVSSKTLAHVQHCQSPQRKISSNFQRADFQIVPLVCLHYTATSNAEEAEVEQFYEDLQDLLELTPKRDVLFIIGDWNAKV